MSFSGLFLFLSCASFFKDVKYFRKADNSISVVSILGQNRLHIKINNWSRESYRYAALNSELEKFTAKRFLKLLSSWPGFRLIPVQTILNSIKYQKLKDDSPFYGRRRRRSNRKRLKTFHNIDPNRAQQLYSAVHSDLFLIMEIKSIIILTREKNRQYGSTELSIVLSCYDKNGILVWKDAGRMKSSGRFLLEGSLDFNINKFQENIAGNVSSIAEKMKANFYRARIKQ